MKQGIICPVCKEFHRRNKTYQVMMFYPAVLQATGDITMENVEMRVCYKCVEAAGYVVAPSIKDRDKFKGFDTKNTVTKQEKKPKTEFKGFVDDNSKPDKKRA